MAFKHCNCCQTDHSKKGWQQLPLVGDMMDLELRNCGCGSTLAVEKKSTKSTLPPSFQVA
jgi:hypothetical protein